MWPYILTRRHHGSPAVQKCSVPCHHHNAAAASTGRPACRAKHLGCPFSLNCNNIPTGQCCPQSLNEELGSGTKRDVLVGVFQAQTLHHMCPLPTAPSHLFFTASGFTRHSLPYSSGPPLCHVPPRTSCGDILGHSKHALTRVLSRDS